MAGAWHRVCKLTAEHGRGTAWVWHGHGMLCANRPLKAELNPIGHFLALLEAHYILHISRIRVNVLINSYLNFTIQGTSFTKHLPHNAKLLQKKLKSINRSQEVMLRAQSKNIKDA